MCGTPFSVQIPKHCLRRTKYCTTNVSVFRSSPWQDNKGQLFFLFSPRGFWKISVFRDVTSCCLLDSEDEDSMFFRNVVGEYSYLPEGLRILVFTRRFQSSGMLRRAACLTLKMKTVCSFETSSANTRIYQSTRRNIPKCLKILSKDISVKNTKCATLTFISPLFIKCNQTEWCIHVFLKSPFVDIDKQSWGICGNIYITFWPGAILTFQ
jgi:hypothetical protein